MLDDGILLRGIEIRGPPDQTIDIGGAVESLALKGLGEFPIRLHQLAEVRLLQYLHFGAIVGAPQYRLTRKIHPGIGINKELAVRGEADSMVRILGSQQLQTLTVKARPIKMSEIRILVLLAPAGQKIDLAVFLINV